MWVKAARRLAAWAAVLGVAGLLVRIGGCADRAFFHPSRTATTAPPGVEEVRFSTSDGLHLHGWLSKPLGASGQRLPVVIHCHGNAGNVENHAGFSEFLVNDGFAVLCVDTRGYGKSDDATPTRATLVRDAHAALDFVLSREDLDPQRIGVLGMSLGGVAGSFLASERAEIRSLALVSAFTAWGAVANDHVPIIGRLLVRSGFDPSDAVARLGAKPLLILHGERDAVVPVGHGRQLDETARAAGVEADLVVMPQADHNDILDSSTAQRALADFFSRTLSQAN